MQLVIGFKNNIYQIREARSDDFTSIKRLAQVLRLFDILFANDSSILYRFRSLL